MDRLSPQSDQLCRRPALHPKSPPSEDTTVNAPSAIIALPPRIVRIRRVMPERATPGMRRTASPTNASQANCIVMCTVAKLR